MVEIDSHTMHCRRIVEYLNNQEGWELDNEAQARYVHEIIKRVPLDRLLLQPERIVRNYHFNYMLVQAISNEHQPEHIEAWTQVRREILAAAQQHHLATPRDPAISSDDIVQIVQVEIARGLASYRYESSLRTWIYSVTIRRLKRLLRDSTAKKRVTQVDSLDSLEYDLIDPEQIEPIANARALSQQVEEILIQADGSRLAAIFRLHALHDRSIEEIGRHVHLHPSRVRVLLTHAREILRANPAIATWRIQHDHNITTSE